MKKELIQDMVTASPMAQNLSSFTKQAAKQPNYTARSFFFLPRQFSEAEQSFKSMGGAHSQSHLTLRPVVQLVIWK